MTCQPARCQSYTLRAEQKSPGGRRPSPPLMDTLYICASVYIGGCVLLTLLWAWFAARFKAAMPLVLPPRTRDIDDAEVMREPDVSDKEAA